MDYVCPEIERFVSCFTCGEQSLPPYNLCAEAHVGCPPCAKYLSLCICGCRFVRGPHTTLDWLVTAMQLKCKYGANGTGQRVPDREDDCANRWFTIPDLRDHYLTGCSRNLFVCPLLNCGHEARIDTITDHYETAHGPLQTLTEPPFSNCVTFKLPNKKAQTIHKIFNGYFMFTVKSRNNKSRVLSSILSMHNINPSDRLYYAYGAMMSKTNITITVTLVEAYISPS